MVLSKIALAAATTIPLVATAAPEGKSARPYPWTAVADMASFAMADHDDMTDQVLDMVWKNMAPWAVQKEWYLLQDGYDLVSDWNLCPICYGTAWGARLGGGFAIGGSGWSLGALRLSFGWSCSFAAPYLGWTEATCAELKTLGFSESAGLWPMLANDFIEPRSLCGYTLNFCHYASDHRVDINQWIRERLDAKPEVARGNDFVNHLYGSMSTSTAYLGEDPATWSPGNARGALGGDPGTWSPTGRGGRRVNATKEASTSTGQAPADKAQQLVKVALFTGLQVDANYKDTGGNPWGSYGKALPAKTVDSMFEFIKTEVKPDLAFWGGDSVPYFHGHAGKEEVGEALADVAAQVQKGLPDLQTYLTIGNLDTYPQNRASAAGAENSKSSTREIFGLLLQEQYSADEEAVRSFEAYGYYSSPLILKDGTPVGDGKAKVISINSNFCYVWNFDQMMQYQDPGGMLLWLEQELGELERTGGAAIILSHIPNLQECNRQLGRRWHALIDRYQHVVRWGASGHNGQEQFQVVRDVATRQPIGMNFIGGSVAPIADSSVNIKTSKQLDSEKNPSFMVVQMDAETLLPVDIDSYSLDLSEANNNGQPTWKKSYSYRETLGLKDLSPKSFYDLAADIYTNDDTAKLVRNIGLAGRGDPEAECAFKCKQRLYCQATSADRDEYQFCVGKDQLDYSDFSGLLASAGQAANSAWYEAGPAERWY